MANHLFSNENAYTILKIKPQWNISIHELNSSYSKACENNYDENRALILSKSYMELKNYISRGKCLLKHMNFDTKEKYDDMEDIFNLQTMNNDEIKSIWIETFYELEKMFNNYDKQVCVLFTKFIYIEQLRKRKGIYITIENNQTKV